MITVYLITGINNLFTDNEYSKFSSVEKKIISLSGCIRGAIAFGLAMIIETGDINKNSILLSSTLIIVFVTTILFGPFIPHLLNKGEEDSSNLYEGLLEDDNKVKFEHPNNEYLSSLIMRRKSELEREPIGLGNFLHKIDMKLKPLLVDDWDKTFNDHVRLTKIIKYELNKQD